MRITQITLFVTFVLAMNIVVPLQAQSIEIVSQSVPYGDLNLNSPEGHDALDRRVAQAVRQVCGEVSARDLPGNRFARQCRKESLAKAIRQRDIAIATYNDRRAGEANLALRNR